MFTLSAVRTQLIQILHLQESPHRTALAFAIGVFIAFAPHYGFHTISVLVFSWAFRLNYLAVLIGSLINNPWTLIPILGLTLYTGLALFGVPQSSSFQWEDIHLEDLFDTIAPYLLPFIVAGCLLGIIGAIIAYPVMLFTIRRYRSLKAH